MTQAAPTAFDLESHLALHYAVAQVEGECDADDEVVLNPSDDRTPFSGEGISIESLAWRQDIVGIPDECYPLVLPGYLRARKGEHDRVVRLMKAGRARYDEGTFNRPPGAVLDSRYTLAFLMTSHGVESMKTRFFDDGDFVERTAGDLMDAIRLQSLYHQTFTQNFKRIGLPFYTAAGLRRQADGVAGIATEGLRKEYMKLQTGRDWVSYYCYLDIIYAFADATDEERKALFASIASADSFAEINVTLGGRIRDNVYTGSGRYPAKSLRYAGELVMLMIKHGVAAAVPEEQTLELTEEGRKLVGLLPDHCNDPDRYGHFLDFSTYPPSLPAHQEEAVKAWLMDYFTRLKVAGASIGVYATA